MYYFYRYTNCLNLFCHFIENRNNRFCNPAILFFCSAAYTNTSGNLPVYKQRIAPGNQCDSRVVCLNRHKRAARGGAGSHIFCFALGNCCGICLSRHKGNAQNQCFPITPVCSGQAIFITDGKADVDSGLFALFMCGSTSPVA